MKQLRIPLLSGALAAGFILLWAISARAQTTIYTDNFNIADTASLDGSDQTGRHTGLLATNLVGRSGGIQHTITNQALNLLRAGGNDGRMRFCPSTNVATTLRWDWASGAAGAQILSDGGMQISFDWTAADNTSDDWVSFSVGITPNSDVNIRVANAGTDSGIILRNNGTAQVFKLGAGGATAPFDVTILSRHVDLKYAFTSWADGTLVTYDAYVDGVLVISQTFNWTGNSGVQNMEISSIANGTVIDNFMVTSFAPPPFISVSAVSDAPSTVYVGRTLNFIGTVGGTQPITNQWKVDKGSGFVNVSASATNTTLSLTNVQLSDSGTYQLFSSNVAGPATSDPLSLTVVAATTTDAINVQFTGGWLGGGTAPTQTDAAAIGNGGDVWNPISNTTGGTSPAGLAQGTNLALVDVANVGTLVTMDYAGDYIFNGAAFGFSNPFIDAASPVAPLMTGYMGSVSQGASPDTNRVTLRNLKPGSYDLYLYSNGRSDGQGRITVFSANGQTAVCGPNSGNNTLIAGTNYVHLTPTVTTNGMLTIGAYGTTDNGQGLWNGFQLNGPVTLPTLFLSSDTTSDSPTTNYTGRTITLLAGFGGFPTPALQWKVDKGSGFVNVAASATNASLTLANVQTADAGSYALFATNVVGISNSTPVALVVLPAPTGNFGVNLNVQFDGTTFTGTHATPQVGPAVVGNAGDFWNPVSNPNPVGGDTNRISGLIAGLLDAAGIGTSLNLDYLADQDLNTGFNNPFVGSGSPAENLMQASLRAVNTNAATVTVHGLLPGSYDLYLYSSAGNGTDQSSVTAFTVNGVTVSAGPNESTTSLMEGTNYVHIAPTVSGNGLLNLSFIGTADGGLSLLNGFQLSGPGATPSLVILDLQRIGAQLQLTWPAGTLLEATNLFGPWTTNIATSPYLFTPSPATPEKYYRVRVQ